MYIIGIDPSLTHTGLVCLDTISMKVVGSQLIVTGKDQTKKIRVSSDIISRCREIYNEVLNFITAWNMGKYPMFVAAETPSGTQNHNAAVGYGIVSMLLAGITPEPIEVTPDEVKKASVGKGTATKAQMILWAVEKHPELPWKIAKSGKTKGKPTLDNEHLADALGVIYAAMKLPEFKRLQNAYTK